MSTVYYTDVAFRAFHGFFGRYFGDIIHEDRDCYKFKGQYDFKDPKVTIKGLDGCEITDFHYYFSRSTGHGKRFKVFDGDQLEFFGAQMILIKDNKTITINIPRPEDEQYITNLLKQHFDPSYFEEYKTKYTERLYRKPSNPISSAAENKLSFVERQLSLPKGLGGP
jgi:hypothetical protein